MLINEVRYRFQADKNNVIAKGKTYIEIVPNEENREIILKENMGWSGNLRAPSVVVDNKLVVGFNEAMYKAFFA